MIYNSTDIQSRWSIKAIDLKFNRHHICIIGFQPCSSAENSTKTLKFEKSSQPLLTNNVYFLNVNVACATKDMLPLHSRSPERVNGPKQKSSSICKPYFSEHNSNVLPCLSKQFHALKCANRFDCLLYEIFLIGKHKPCLNIQSDSMKAKLFTQPLGPKNLNLNNDILVIC